MKKFQFIPYNKNLVSRARELRKESTNAEKLFWTEILKSKELLFLKFTRQKPIGGFIADFYCSSLQIAIEVDGEVHAFQQARDKERDNVLWQKFGIRVLRYKNVEVLNDTERVKKEILKETKKTHP